MSNGIIRLPLPDNEPINEFRPGSPERLALTRSADTIRRNPVAVPLVIGGNHVHDRKTVKITSPQKKTLTIATSQEATEADVKHAIASALEARASWSAMPWEDRASVFLKAADLVSTKYRGMINAATMLGQSKTCYQTEIDAVCELADFLRFNVHFARKIYEEQPAHSPRGLWNRSYARGLEGFVFAVAPFNFTSISINLATAPAMMGCTVVWKPSPTSVLSSYVGMQILEEAGLPPGVINLVTGDAQVIGPMVMTNPHLAGLHFTGSTATFEHLWAEIGRNIGRYNTYPRIVGETGGKDFVFAHASADRDALVTALIRGAFEYQGQKCSAASRAYIPQSVWDDIKDPLLEQTRALKVGDPENFGNFMGAVIDQRSFNKIKGFIDHAKNASDARVLCGGECDDREGYFIRPTIIQATNPQYKSMVEEIFGPVLTVYVYPDSELKSALKACDQTSPYALTGAIFARDRKVITELADTLQNCAGNFYINDKPTGAVVGQQPFGGARKSGTNDKAGSMFNLLRWVSHRTVKENFLSPTQYSYPYMDGGT